jgi:hypothetical protein
MTAANAQAVADRFIASFVAGDLDATVALFAPDALFWGTTMGELGTTPDRVHAYFSRAFAARATTPVRSASITDSAATVLSDDAVVMAGRWQVERPGVLSLNRFTMVMRRDGDDWKIAHFHSSPRPQT